MNRAQGLAGLALLLVAVAAGLWWGGRQTDVPSTLPEPVSTSATAAAVPMLTVHVAGLVRRPGLVQIPEGSRVADAIAAAGGLLPGSSTESINLAAPVADGEQVVVPGNGQGPLPSSSASPDGKLHLNLATAAELDALPGIGPVIAERIVSFREEFGPFQSVDDLLDVPGIGEARLADLRDRLQVP
jgi:competence protein ComEA